MMRLMIPSLSSNTALQVTSALVFLLLLSQGASSFSTDTAASSEAAAGMMSNNARRMTSEAVRKTKMYVASKNGRIISWSDLLPSSCLADADAAERCDDGIHPSPLDATSLLKLLPRGAYTTCRTIGRGTSVYSLSTMLSGWRPRRRQ